MATTIPSHTVLKLRIQLDGVTPTVWRQLLVPGGIKLAKLHDLLQVAMGWSDLHLHAFRIGDKTYGMQDEDDDYPEDELDEEWVAALQALADHKTFAYDYDFGAGWVHQVTVEDRLLQRTPLRFAVCLDGANACPPDGVDGPSGYADFLVGVADPTHPEHAEIMEWLGGPFDPTFFDLAEANIALQATR
jgi:hypothetical protein